MVSMVIGCLEDEDTVGEFPTSLRKLPKTPFLRNDSAIAVAHFRQGTKGCDLSPTIHQRRLIRISVSHTRVVEYSSQ
jgi:hypothetical protein